MRRAATGVIVLVFVFLAAPVWAHGPRGLGHSSGFHSGFRSHGLHSRRGFHSGFRSHSLHSRFGSSHLHRHGFGHRQHFSHTRFFRPHRHFGHRGFVSRSFGFHDNFFVGNSFIPAGPSGVVISSPFFCFPHRLGFPSQALLLAHLHHAHRIPHRNALSSCTPVGSRFIFFGF